MLVLLLIGLGIRLALLFLDFAFDVNNHIVWAKDLLGRGFAGFYETASSAMFATVYPNYPPLANFLFYLFYPIQNTLFKILWWLNLSIPAFPSKIVLFVESRAFLAAMLKLPAVFADLGIAWLCYLFVKKILPKNKKAQFIAPAFILFNPAFFQSSAFWGQIDAVPIFFTIAAFYLLIFTKKYIWSAIFLTLGLLVKPTILVFAPIFIVYFLWRYKTTAFLKAVLISDLVFWLAFLPFFKSGNLLLFPYSTYINKIMATQSLPFVTNGAFNFWVLITQFKGIDAGPYNLWAYLITGIFYLIIIHLFFQRRDKKQAVLYACFLSALAAFLFLTKMHERYLMLPLPFLLLAGLKDKSLWKWFIILSGVSYLNLYHSWPVPYIAILKNTLSNPVVYISTSLFNVLVFLYLLRRYKV